ncbi:hypothetical protein KSS87_012159 [Heliosperma pusillum]|nr:hypothetical protein KSS87_012159 [Heliosperma pusillum]
MDLFTLTPSFHPLPLPKPRTQPSLTSFHHPNHRRIRTLRCSTTMPTTALSTVQFDLRGYWTSLIDEINTKLDESIPVSYPEGIYEAMRYSVLDNAAKRAPPVHAASLIHDDLPCMDNDQERRGHPANHVVYGEDMAILAGDALFPLGFRHIVTHTPPELVPETQILKVIAEIARCVGSTGMAAGQIVDLEDGPNMVDYIQDKKFGELAECSAVCGGLLAGANEDEIQRLRRYGRAVGVLYHLVDDILKVKAIGDKRDEGKKKKGKNYVSVYGVEKAIEVAEDLRAQAKKELDGFEKYGDKVTPLYSFVEYAADRGFSIGT